MGCPGSVCPEPLALSGRDPPTPPGMRQPSPRPIAAEPSRADFPGQGIVAFSHGGRAGSLVYVGQLTALALVYGFAAQLSLRLAIVPQVTPIWPPTGIAVVALFLFGRRLWPAIFIGAFLVNVPISPTVLVAAIIGVGNVAAPLAVVLLLERANFRPELDRLRDAVVLVGAALGGMLISATGGAFTLAVAGGTGGQGFFPTWSVWWAGDAMGVLIVAPLLFGIRSLHRPAAVTWQRSAEAFLLLAVLSVGTHAVFVSHLRVVYLVFPLLIWAAWRFGLPGAATAALIVSTTAIWAAESGTGPFLHENLFQRMATLQIFNACVAFASFVAAAIVAERQRSRQQLEQALEVERQAGERLRALDDLRRTFLHAVSHELRTPLTSVLGIALTLQRQDVELEDAEQAELIGRLASNARRLDLLLRDLLDLDRLDRGILEPRLEPADVGALVGRMVSDKEALKPRRVHAETPRVVIPIDSSKVERIVENLLANAVRHTPSEASIWVRVAAFDGGVVISVEDDGPGVPSELRARVFEPFQQALGGPEPSPGLGIGLSLVARFAELHRGRAWVEERPGGGASFRVFLPDPGELPVPS
jgi:signal transduction histidine kinase